MAISVTPDRLDFKLEKNETGQQDLLIKNLGTEPAQIQINLGDQRFKTYVSINPSDVVLAAGAEQNFLIIAEGKKDFETVLQILASPGVNADLQIRSGIELPLSVDIPNNAANPAFLLSLFLAFAVIGIMYFWRKRNRAQA